MKKILLTFVGEQDPYSDKTESEGSIVTLARSINPDLVFMFPSKRMPGIKSETETNAGLTKDWLSDDVGLNKDNIFISPLALADPRNIPTLLAHGRSEIRQILESLGAEDLEIAINTSSGTPQMQSCWFIWVNSGLFVPYLVTLYQVGNPQFVPEEKRVETITVEFMEESNAIGRIRNYLENKMYLSAAEEANRLSQISCYSNRRLKAKIIVNICNVYHNWDLLNYTDSLSSLKATLARYDKCMDLEDFTIMLNKQVEILAKLSSSNPDEITVLMDIYYNAQRCFCRNAYADTLARIWRLIEGCLYHRLRSKHGIEPRDVNSSRDEGNKTKIISAQRESRELSFAKSVVALKDVLNDNGYTVFENKVVELPWGDNIRKVKVKSATDNIRTIRNDSIVAHGMKPVSRVVAQSSLEIGKLFLGFTFKQSTLIADYPFKGDECVGVLSGLL